jgi:hypothetical protein
MGLLKILNGIESALAFPHDQPLVGLVGRHEQRRSQLLQ